MAVSSTCARQEVAHAPMFTPACCGLEIYPRYSTLFLCLTATEEPGFARQQRRAVHPKKGSLVDYARLSPRRLSLSSRTETPVSVTPSPACTAQRFTRFTDAGWQLPSRVTSPSPEGIPDSARANQTRIKRSIKLPVKSSCAFVPH
jgi:hypothetical protein